MFGDTPGVVRYNLVTEDKQHYITPKEDLPNADAWFAQAYPDPTLRERARATWQSATAGNDAGTRSYRITAKDGTQREMMISSIPQPQGALALFIDISEQKRAEQALAAALEEQRAQRLAALNLMEDACAAQRTAEAAADQSTVGEELLDLLRRGIGGDVEVFGRPAKQQIAHTAADQIGLVAGLVQAIEHLQGVVTDLATRDGMLVSTENQALLCHGLALLFVFTEYLAAEIRDLGKNSTPPGYHPLVAAAL